MVQSELPGELRRKKAAAYPAVAQDGSKEIMGSGTQP